MDDEEIDFHEIRDNPSVLHAIAFEGKLPFELVLDRALPEIRKRIRWFLLGAILVQPILLALWGVSVNQIPVLSSYKWLLPFCVGFGAVGVLITQLLLIHEEAHHSVFYPAKNSARIRLVLVSVAFTITVIPFYLFVPIETSGFPSDPPHFTLYSAISGFVVALVMPYLSKLAWDYFRLDATSATRWMAVFIGIILTFLGGTITVGILAELFNPTNIEIARTFIISASVGGALAVGLIRGMSNYRDPDTYVRDGNENRHKLMSRVLTAIRTNRILTVVSGTLAGLALPLLAGVNHVLTVNVGFEYLNIGLLLIVGYANLVVAIVLFVVFDIALIAIAISVLFTSEKLATHI